MDLKTKNARMRLESAAIQTMQAAKLNEIQAFIRLAGGNPTLWDYPTGTVLANAVTGNVASSVFTLPHDFFRNAALVRIVAVGTGTPTCTYAIQGSVGGANWASLNYADYLAPATIVATTFVIASVGTTTAIKLVPAGQMFNKLRVNMTANTTVTNTIDVVYL